MKKTIFVLIALISISTSHTIQSYSKKVIPVAAKECIQEYRSPQELFQLNPAPNLTIRKTIKLAQYWVATSISIEGMYHSVLAGSYLGGIASATCYLVGTAGFIDNFFDAFYVEPQAHKLKKR